MVETKIQFKNENFLDDKEKMADFHMLTKEEFLKSYSYLTEEEYDNTYDIYHSGKYYLVLKEGIGQYFNKRYEVWNLTDFYPTMTMWSSDKSICEEHIRKYNHTEKPKRESLPFDWMES